MPEELAPFDVSIDAAGATVIINLSGELDYGTVRTLQGALASVARDHPRSPLRIDLRGLDFIDSAGMSALIGANTAARSRGATLQIVRGSAQVQRPLEVVGMDQIVEFVDG